MSNLESFEVGVLFSDWDERLGPKLVGAQLPGISEDPENLATKSYMSAQNVFSSVEFSHISFSLPNLKIQRKIALFFDVVLDESVRGGRRPFFVAIFLPLDIPDAFTKTIQDRVEQAMDVFKGGTPPNIAQLRDQLQNAFHQYTCPSASGKMEMPAEEDKTLVFTVHCELCKELIHVGVSKSQLKATPQDGISEFTYIHGFDRKGVDPHGLKVNLDEDDALVRIEYVDLDGNRVSPVKEADIASIQFRLDPWGREELKQLAREMRNGTHIRTLVQQFQRPPSAIEKQMKEIEQEKLQRFNALLKSSVAEATSTEKTDPASGKELWQKIAEYCIAFSRSPGITPQVSLMIRQKTRGIIQRARKTN